MVKKKYSDKIQSMLEKYPYFSKIIKWLCKPNHYKDKYRNEAWEQFDPDKCIEIITYENESTVRMDVTLHWSKFDGKIFDRFVVDYDYLSFSGRYTIYVYFWGARCHYGDCVTVEDIIKEYGEDDALHTIQRCCYQFM